MTVSNQTPLKAHTANGVTTSFPFDFQVLDAGTLKVYVGGSLVTTGYTVSGIGSPSGGSVVFAVAPANGARILLARVSALSRPTDFTEDLPVEVLNRDADRVWLALQEVTTGITANVLPALASVVGVEVNLRAFGGVGKGAESAAVDTTALTDAITWANTQTDPVRIKVPRGRWHITSAPPVMTTSVVIAGEGPRQSKIFPIGSFDFLRWIGAASRIPNAGISSLLIDCASHTGVCVTADWTQGFDITDDVVLANVDRGVYFRQCGEPKMRGRIDTGRGAWGVYCYATNTARNGENDQIDALSFGSDCTISGNYTPGGAVPTFECVVLDGRVHTVTYGALRLLSGLRGIKTANSMGLAQKFVPSFFFGAALESESHYAECALFDSVNDLDSAVWAASSITAAGIKLGNQVTMFKPSTLRAENCAQDGLLIDGAQGCVIGGMHVFRNSQASVAGFDAVRIVSGTDITFLGGTAGKPTFDTGGAYSERQRYGINNVGGSRIKAYGVVLRDNATGPVNGDVQLYECPGVADAATLTAVTYSPNMTLPTDVSSKFEVTATNGSAFAFEAPPNLRRGTLIRLTIRNASGGALGAISGNLVFKLAGNAWPSPANGFNRTIEFLHNGTHLVEQWRSPSDIPN